MSRGSAESLFVLQNDMMWLPKRIGSIVPEIAQGHGVNIIVNDYKW